MSAVLELSGGLGGQRVAYGCEEDAMRDVRPSLKAENFSASDICLMLPDCPGMFLSGDFASFDYLRSRGVLCCPLPSSCLHM